MPVKETIRQQIHEHKHAKDSHNAVSRGAVARPAPPRTVPLAWKHGKALQRFLANLPGACCLMLAIAASQPALRGISGKTFDRGTPFGGNMRMAPPLVTTTRPSQCHAHLACVAVSSQAHGRARTATSETKTQPHSRGRTDDHQRRPTRPSHRSSHSSFARDQAVDAGSRGHELSRQGGVAVCHPNRCARRCLACGRTAASRMHTGCTRKRTRTS